MLKRHATLQQHATLQATCKHAMLQHAACDQALLSGRNTSGCKHHKTAQCRRTLHAVGASLHAAQCSMHGVWHGICSYDACCKLSVERRTCTPVEMSSACITFQSSTAVPPSSLKAAQLSLTASPSSLQQVRLLTDRQAGRQPYSRHGATRFNGYMNSAFTWAARDTHQMPLRANTRMRGKPGGPSGTRRRSLRGNER